MSLSLTFQKEYKEWYIHNFAGIEERGNLSPCFALIPMKLWDNLFAHLLCFQQVPEPPNALLKNISEKVYT